ncbi:nuclear transport factor 2 family protein [Pontibacter sp. G13]|uniref:YybH family protein n=1 Tax=Pontibacter sp. G13 TaxID=3074898 RepID=UPI00288BE5BB|nr:nuclear transport factor 2 family protein [Pontibacter sp. G13]WNJ17280.1 nuclear transport factor 2 family protein [Pontibacter sp. G13]
MKIRLWIWLALLMPAALQAQMKPLPKETRADILAVFAKQEQNWNDGDIDGFMEGYWKSDSLTFIGSKGITYGWQQTLDNYHQSYPDRVAMGRLTFKILKMYAMGDNKTAFVIGQWHLDRAAGDVGGHFTLIWKKIAGKWVIVSDHTS